MKLGSTWLKLLILLLALGGAFIWISVGCNGDGDSSDTICTDTCGYANNGTCDDGGEGSDSSICDFGTDCNDCNPRNPADCPPTCEIEGTTYECGADGCGGECGTCEGDALCYQHQCCTANCEGRECGLDGCGGECGTCEDGETCDASTGTCSVSCSCGDRECGDDGCGEICGQCTDDQYCDEDGHCIDCDCGERECHTDRCGNPCGECTLPDICNTETGMCEEGDPLCNDSCMYPRDHSCDDGGRDCNTSLCEFGSDCEDCGSRTEDDRLPEGEGCY